MAWEPDVNPLMGDMSQPTATRTNSSVSSGKAKTARFVPIKNPLTDKNFDPAYFHQQAAAKTAQVSQAQEQQQLTKQLQEQRLTQIGDKFKSGQLSPALFQQAVEGVVHGGQPEPTNKTNFAQSAATTLHGVGVGTLQLPTRATAGLEATAIQAITGKPTARTPNGTIGKILMGSEPIQSSQVAGSNAAIEHPGGFRIPGLNKTLSPTVTGAVESGLNFLNNAAVVKGGANVASNAKTAISDTKNLINNTKTNTLLNAAQEPKTVVEPIPTKTPALASKSAPVESGITDFNKSGISKAAQYIKQELSKPKGEGGFIKIPGKEKPILEKQVATEATQTPATIANVLSKSSPKASIPEVTSPTTIPKEGKFRGAISVSGDLSRQGASGKEIADRLSKAEAASETGQADFIKRIQSQMKLNKNEYPQFSGTLDELTKVEGTPQEQEILNSLDPKLKQAVDEHAANIQSIVERARATGIDMGNLGKYYFPHNYSEVLADKNKFNLAAQHLVKTGQASDLGEAVQALQFMKNKYATPFGHFQNSRIFDLPGYDTSKNAMTGYVQGAFNKIGHAEQFGPKGEQAMQLIGNIAKEGRNSERALKNYQIATGVYKYDQPTLTKVSEDVRTFNRVTKLGLSSILNATQSANPAAMAGVFRTAKAALKTMSPAERAYVDKTGTIIDSVINDLRTQSGIASNTKKGLGKLLNAPGFGLVEKFNRRVAAIAGKDWANSLAARGKVNILRDKLGVEGDIGKTLTEEQQIQASRKLVELTQFKTGAKDLPAWANSPQGKLVSQFRTFSYKQTGFVYNELIKTALKGNPLPLLRYTAVGIPLGYGSGQIRGKLRGQPWTGIKGNQDKPGKGTGNTIFEALNNVGAFGLGGDFKFLAQNKASQRLDQYLASTVGGPTAGQAIQLTKGVSTLFKGQPKDIERQAASDIPVAGPYITNKYLPYGASGKTLTDNALSKNKAVADVLKQTGVNMGVPSQTQRNVKLDNNQYKQFVNTSNQDFFNKVNTIVKKIEYKEAPPDTQRKALEKALADSRVTATDKILGKQPKLKVDKVQQRSIKQIIGQ